MPWMQADMLPEVQVWLESERRHFQGHIHRAQGRGGMMDARLVCCECDLLEQALQWQEQAST